MRIVALRALGLGDLLTAVPALRALQAAHPGATVTLATPEVLHPLVRLAGCTPVAATPLGPLPEGAGGADLLVNLHGRGPQSHRVALAARPRRLVAFEHPAVSESAGMPRWRADEHEVARWCRLLDESGIPADPARLALPVPALSPRLRIADGATVVHPGAASGARRWPPARFAQVARGEVAAGRSVVVTGGSGERDLAVHVARGAGLGPEAVLGGRTTLLELAAVIAHAGRVVSGDTGVAHLATAFGRPSVVLFGPTSPATWGPPPGRRDHRVLWSGRTGDPHGGRPHAGLLAIEPDAVLAELATLA
ncbi:MAG: glycosyl transferase, family 9 [Solirubrobacterales bacterium]|nr:glycosyl transferase, family 9 [Solirubrobacterales bacterium]